MAIRTITWTVDENMRVTPTRVQNAGVQGDDNATRVVFSLPAFLQAGYTLYIEYIDGAGGYDKTDPLEVSGGGVSVTLPLAWTQHGGEATVRLVAEQNDVVAYTAEGRVRYDGRATAFAKIKSLLEGSIQAAQDKITKMIADAKVWIDNVNGVYVGSGDMPDGAVIQIDPTGEAMDMKDWVRTDALLDLVYPVGSIYMSVNAADPSALFGGTWERLKDRFLLAAGDSYAAGATGGEATHTLTVAELPGHRHEINPIINTTSGTEYTSSSWMIVHTSDNLVAPDKTMVTSAVYGGYTGYAGGGQSHNNIQLNDSDNYYSYVAYDDDGNYLQIFFTSGMGGLTMRAADPYDE